MQELIFYAYSGSSAGKYKGKIDENAKLSSDLTPGCFYYSAVDTYRIYLDQERNQFLDWVNRNFYSTPWKEIDWLRTKPKEIERDGGIKNYQYWVYLGPKLSNQICESFHAFSSLAAEELFKDYKIYEGLQKIIFKAQTGILQVILWSKNE